jgi:hypothetical protein
LSLLGFKLLGHDNFEENYTALAMGNHLTSYLAIYAATLLTGTGSILILDAEIILSSSPPVF